MRENFLNFKLQEHIMMVLAFWEFCDAIFELRKKSRRSAETFGEKIVLIVPSTYDILYQS